MKIYTKLLISMALLFPLTSFAVTATWQTPTTTAGYIVPNLINGTNQTIKLPTIIGSVQCLQADSSGLVTGTGATCNSGGGGGSASLPFTGIQFSIPSGTTTAFSASSSFEFSTSTGQVSLPFFVATSSATSTTKGPLTAADGQLSINNLGQLSVESSGIFPSNNFFSAQFGNAINILGSSAGFEIGDRANNAHLWQHYANNDEYSIWNNSFGNSLNILYTSGFVGIATDTPDTRLSVNGTTTTKGLKIYGLPNSVLATDVNGNVVATTSSSGGSGTVTTITAGTGITLSSGATCTTTCTVSNSGVLSIGGLTGTVATTSLGLAGYLVPTTILWVDANRNDSYPAGAATGSIEYPYQTLSAAITAGNKLGSVAYYLAASTTYLEFSSDFFTSPTIIHGNNSTIAYVGGATSTTFTNAYDVYDTTFSGNVNSNDANQNNGHTFQASGISGNLNVNAGIVGLSGASSVLTGGTLNIAAGAQLNAVGVTDFNPVVNQGQIFWNNNLIQVATSSYALNSNFVGSLVTMAADKIINTGGGGGLGCQNGATSTINEVNAIDVITTAASTSSTGGINCGTAVTQLSKYNIFQSNVSVQPVGVALSGAGDASEVVLNTITVGGASTANGIFDVLGAATTSTSTIGLSNLLASFIGNVPNYAQIYLQNIATSGISSADFVVGGDKGTATSTNYFGDFGYANTGSVDSTFPAILPNDSYLYDTDGGLDIFTATTSAANTIRFYTGGASTSTNRITISNSTTTLNGNVVIASSTAATTSNAFTVVNGVFSQKMGTNQAMGTSTLSGGTVTVSNTQVQANSVIFLTDQTGGTNLGSLSVGTKTPGTSFVINSSNVLDASVVAWYIVQPL